MGLVNHVEPEVPVYSDRYDRSLALGEGGALLTSGQKVGMALAGFGLLLFVVAAFGAGPISPVKAFVAGLLVLVFGLVLYYTRSLAAPTTRLSKGARTGLVLFGAGLLGLLAAATGAGSLAPVFFFAWGIGLTCLGGLLYFRARYAGHPAGIRNDGLMHSATTARGAVGWLLGIVFTGFYVLLYWFPGALEGLIRTVDPLSHLLRGGPADQWFLYGTFYTLAVLVMGVRALYRYRHSRYQVLRTLSVMFFQLVFAYLIPAILVVLNQPEFYFSYFWPLKYSYLWPSDVGWLMAHPGGLGVFMVFWGVVLSFVATPILTYFFGKRWYCSWVCGCGGLAETFGDPWRHLSDKSLKAWQIERWMVHGVLVFVVVTTALLWINSATEGAIFGGLSQAYARAYGFLIGAVFAGVIGVGFYPVMGSRVWCRFGCPMAAILGLFQKYFSRFRITTNGGQCISCGNCSAYCEMGIDVRWYAQRGQNVIRASCVGCGICSAVCPRGVLNLENGPRRGRYNGPVLVERDALTLLSEEDVAG
ncbi:4Fe-4S binding protein [Rhodocaloribacter litoris]|uniref:4Fe-4S binding protein n=1 Tax=Rhodocaloribacter litoris TaxID=2558931 RepID=UPI001E52E302|nr:4Fe-4S dicluster domain-containing protein [Rhodocaloribacter litoris]QXD15368.1 4Fe-4S binding protein [Rhodocaloribacter litoris]